MPPEKRRVLLSYPFFINFEFNRIDPETFLDNLVWFEEEFLSKGISKEEIGKLREYTQQQKFVGSAANKLERLYFNIPNYIIILEGVRRGREEFENDVKKLGFKSPRTSQTHSYRDVEVQAFALGIPADWSISEIAVKSYHTYGAHFVDDLIERPDIGLSEEFLEKNCMNFDTCLNAVGRLGVLMNAMIKKAVHPDAARKGLHRMIYGSLIQKTPIGEKQIRHLREFKELGLFGVAPAVAKDIRKIKDIPYWMTTKTVLELDMSSDPHFDMTRTELWNLIYAPAIYYHDIAEEEIGKEINFAENPSINDMVQMINISTNHISNHIDERFNQRILQLKFVLAVFQKNLPQHLQKSYKNLITILEELSNKQPASFRKVA